METQRLIRGSATDVTLRAGAWPVSGAYSVQDGFAAWLSRGSGRWVHGRPTYVVERPDGRLFWADPGLPGWPSDVPADETAGPLRDLLHANDDDDLTRVRVIVDEGSRRNPGETEWDPEERLRSTLTDLRMRAPLAWPGLGEEEWDPGERPGLAEELAALGDQDEATIVRWVKEHGFLGVRADPFEWGESVEEIRSALADLRLARDLMRAIRELSGERLRVEVERLLEVHAPPEGWTALLRAEDSPLRGELSAHRYGVAVPDGIKWPGAGAHIQALDILAAVLRAWLGQLLRVDSVVVPTGDGIRLEGAIVARGPLAAAFLQTLDEASWPPVTWTGSLLKIDWHAPRRCGRCGALFTPGRRDQRWCTRRCRWAASKASQANRPHVSAHDRRPPGATRPES